MMMMMRMMMKVLLGVFTVKTLDLAGGVMGSKLAKNEVHNCFPIDLCKSHKSASYRRKIGLF